MTHSVDVRELQEHFPEYMQKLRAGDTIVIRSNGETIGRIEPEQAAKPRVHRRFQDIPLPDIPLLDIDPAEVLIADRDEERNG